MFAGRQHAMRLTHHAAPTRDGMPRERLACEPLLPEQALRQEALPLHLQPHVGSAGRTQALQRDHSPPPRLSLATQKAGLLEKSGDEGERNPGSLSTQATCPARTRDQEVAGAAVRSS